MFSRAPTNLPVKNFVCSLQFKRVDLGFSQLFVKLGRRSIIDFTTQYDFDFNCFLVKKYPPLPQARYHKNAFSYPCVYFFNFFGQVLAFVRPFDLTTWVLIACSAAAAVAFVLVAWRLDRQV